MGGSVPMQLPLRTGTDGVSPVVAEILLVAITVVLAAVLYLMASGLLAGPTNIPPTVAFSATPPYTGASFNTSFSVADASRSITIANYRFNMKVGSEYGNATDFGASGVAVTEAVGRTTYKVIWTDLDGGGTLSQGDEITVAGNGVSLPVATSFDFLLLWSDGAQLTHEAWTTP